MRLYRCNGCTRDIKDLSKKFRDFERDLDYALNLIRRSSNPPASFAWPELGFKRGGVPLEIFKMKIAVRQLGGKSKGPRLVYERLEVEGEVCVVLLAVYIHQDREGHDQAVRGLLPDRIRSYDASSLDALWKTTTELERKT